MQLYMVNYPANNAYADASPIPVEHDYERFASCPLCGTRVSGAYWQRPREVVLTRHKAPDFLYAYCDNAPFVVTERVLEGIRREGLTGLLNAEEIENARFQRKPKQEKYLPKYYHIEVARSRITIDHEKSIIKYGTRGYGGKKEGPGCPLCRQVLATYDFYKKLALRMEAYEGYDIFQTYELCDQLFVSQRFVDMAGKWGLTNLCCKPVENSQSECWDYISSEENE